MKKGKWGQARKKAPPPEDKNKLEEDVQDDEMQLQFSAKNDKTNNSTVNSSSTITPLVPSTAKATKECDGSISTSLTKTSNSWVGSTVHVGNATTTKLLSENILSEKKVLRFETDKPINFLTDIKTDAVIRIVTKHIYLTCRFIAQVDHMDSATCFIFTKIRIRKARSRQRKIKPVGLHNQTCNG